MGPFASENCHQDSPRPKEPNSAEPPSPKARGILLFQGPLQVHIPKRGIHGRLEPSRLDEDGLPEDLRELRDLEAMAEGHSERMEERDIAANTTATSATIIIATRQSAHKWRSPTE